MNHPGLGRSHRAMPKRILLAMALAALGLAACNNGLNYNSLYGTPTPTPTASYSPNPNITSTNVVVTVTGTPQPNVTVTEYLSSNGAPTGSALATATTDSTGTANFTGLTPTQPYCWQVTFPSPPSGFTSSTCTLYWQNGIRLGD